MEYEPIIEGVEAEFEYVSPESSHNFHFLGGGREVNTGRFERHRVFVCNARLAPDTLALETSGFTLLRHHTETDLYDEAAAQSAYPAEIERLLLEVTGADKAVVFGPRRRHVTQTQAATLPAASDVHVDYAAPDARRLAAQLIGLGPDEAVPYRRYMAVNLWRALSPPPQDRPLAVCDARSVTSQSGAFNTLMLVDEIPAMEEMLAATEDDPNRRRGFLFHFDPNHRWYYYPDMRQDEILLFKLYDSVETGSWRCPHASFVDPTVSGAVPRESYEIRSFVYFH